MSPCFGGKNKKCIFAKKSKMKDSVLSYKYFRSGAAWIFFILGIVLYYIGYFQIDSQSVWKEIFIKGGDILIIGVILGYLSNAAQFLGIFKQDLQDIIYGKEFIKQRKDITPLWETISKQMFKNKFPAIHKILRTRVDNFGDGAKIYVEVSIVYGYNVIEGLKEFKRKAQKEIEKLTAMNVVELDIVAKNIYVEQDDNKEEE